jgi:purine nucleoside phosphorylase
MSGAPEVAHANRLGLPVVAVTVVTNPCTGIDCAVPSHGEVLAASARAALDLGRVVKQFIVKL